MCEKPSPSNEALALKYAIEIRKFEIELYWKRTSYFWALITVILGSIGYTIKQKHHEATIILSCVAVVLSCAWVFVNKGSKFWQENWEIQVAKREKNIIGTLFNNVFYKKPIGQEDMLTLMTRSYSMSVSRINLLVSWFIFFICITLLIFSWIKYGLKMNDESFFACFSFTAISIFFCTAIISCRSGIKAKPWP